MSTSPEFNVTRRRLLSLAGLLTIERALSDQPNFYSWDYFTGDSLTDDIAPLRFNQAIGIMEYV